MSEDRTTNDYEDDCSHGQKLNSIGCRYYQEQVCILSDCPCMKSADGDLICSSFVPKSKSDQ